MESGKLSMFSVHLAKPEASLRDAKTTDSLIVQVTNAKSDTARRCAILLGQNTERFGNTTEECATGKSKVEKDYRHGG